MQIINILAEEKLLTTIKIMKKNGKCLHIGSSALSKSDFPKLLSLVNSLIREPEGKLLICEDRDLFLFSNNFSLEIYNKFKARIESHIKEEGIAEFEIISFYDIALNYVGLLELAEAKLQQKNARHKIEAKKQNIMIADLKKENFLSAVFDPILVKTIDKRRSDRSSIKVLVVDDDPFFRRLVGMSFGHNISVFLSHNGEEAIASYLKEAPDVVFLDIELPHITGHDILEKLLSIDPKCYVVMLSAVSNAENIKRATAIGAKGFIRKPFTKDKLVQYIEKCPKSQASIIH